MKLGPDKRRETKEIVVSTTRTPSTDDWGPKEVYRDGLRRGFSGGIYHWVIRRCGTMVSCRDPDWPALGLRPSNRNFRALHIGVVGGFEKGELVNNFQPCQLRSLQDLLAHLRTDFPEAKVDLPNVLQEPLKGLTK